MTPSVRGGVRRGHGHELERVRHVGASMWGLSKHPFEQMILNLMGNIEHVSDIINID
jgi:hypothetical protein